MGTYRIYTKRRYVSRLKRLVKDLWSDKFDLCDNLEDEQNFKMLIGAINRFSDGVSIDKTKEENNNV